MSIHVDWYDPEKTIIYFDFDRNWSWIEFRTAFRQGQDLMAAVKHRVDLLFDMRESSAVSPDGMFVLRRLAAETVPLNMGLTIVVGRDVRILLFWQMFSSVDHTAARNLNLHCVTSLSDAFNLLRPSGGGTGGDSLPASRGTNGVNTF